jgi:hypothetical protein
MAGQRRRRFLEEPIATYADPKGRHHRIVLWGRLVLDLCPRRPAILVAELSADEGVDQARAAVFGGEFDPGYLARAEAGERGLGRNVRAEELRTGQAAHADEREHPDEGLDSGWRLAA